ncbi:phage holin family protein [Acidipropionibacterium jensenii]|uniref:phage holin family protein n=1 Tax=Acidipropionibacterium jensenii TaxID=1749 RepID=UPI00214C353B|nr:phage holin family protein [Acidipropionibacterium jensenii]
MPDTSPVSEIIATLKSDGQSLVQDNIALAKAETKPIVIHAGIGGGLFGSAAYFAINAATLFFVCGGFALSLWAQHLWDWSLILSLLVGFGVMGVLLLLLAAILAVVGKFQIDKVSLPKATIAEAKQTVASLKSAFQHGLRSGSQGGKPRE